jgi:RNA polymerase sigma-70 factor, ECF subfamily
MVRLADQDRALWNRDLINDCHRLVRACLRRNQPGPYQIHAAIAAVHADAGTAAAIDWAQSSLSTTNSPACDPTRS